MTSFGTFFGKMTSYNEVIKQISVSENAFFVFLETI